MTPNAALQWMVDLYDDTDFLSPYQRELLRREVAEARLALYVLRRVPVGETET